MNKWLLLISLLFYKHNPITPKFPFSESKAYAAQMQSELISKLIFTADPEHTGQ